MIKKLLLAFSSFLLILAPFSAHAQISENAFTRFFDDTFTSDSGLYKGGDNLKDTLPTAIGKIIGLMISFIGVILLVLMVWAGFLWLTAGGNEEQVAKAKQYIKNGVIGLIIALSAYIITQFVVSQVNDVLNTGAAPGTEEEDTGEGFGNEPSGNTNINPETGQPYVGWRGY